MFVGAWLLVSGGCNCLIDASKYRGGGGDGDAGEIDAADNLPDAGPPDGRIESDAGPIEPTSAREGEGSGTGAPPVMIVLRGTFEAGSTARVVRSDDATETDLVVEPAVVSGDGTMLAVGIRIPVYDDTAEGDTATLAVYVDPPGADPEDLIDNFTVHGLDERDLSGAVDTTMLRPLYSRITVSGNVAFTGASPAILRSTSDITVGANLVGDGKLGGAAGPGGCAGGAAATSGSCDTHGGTGGATQMVGTGGGGGGHVQDGNPGGGGTDGGDMSGSDMLTPLIEDGGHGGGGGGNGLADLVVGGPGGGGGGIVELTADGRVAVQAVVNVRGGDGSDAVDGVCGTAAGASGGGGSGGAILVRASRITGAGSLDATRGLGGDRCNFGGNGSPGRIRVDVANEELPALTADPAPVRGPHWADDTPHLVTASAQLTLTLYGEPNRTFAANLDGSAPDDVETDGSGIGEYTVTLEAGHNRICAIVDPDANLTLPEAVRCMIVTYVPE